MSSGLDLRRVLWLVAIALAAAVVTLVVTAERLPRLDRAALEAARGRWRQAGIASYRLELEMEGTELEKGVYQVSMPAGGAATATRNGRSITGDAAAYGIDGLFGILEGELAMAEDPGRSGQAASGYATYVFARFDAKSGIPWQFRRVIGGSSRSVEWRIRRFTPE